MRFPVKPKGLFSSNGVCSQCETSDKYIQINMNIILYIDSKGILSEGIYSPRVYSPRVYSPMMVYSRGYTLRGYTPTGIAKGVIFKPMGFTVNVKRLKRTFNWTWIFFFTEGKPGVYRTQKEYTRPKGVYPTHRSIPDPKEYTQPKGVYGEEYIYFFISVVWILPVGAKYS